MTERPLQFVLRRDRLVVAAGLAAITLLAWFYMAREARAMADTGVCQCLGLKMSGPDTKPWTAVELVPLFLMWSEMMVAMMVPSAAPMILLFARLNRKRRDEDRPYVSTGIFLGGYLVAWTTFSAMAAVGQWILHGLALISPESLGWKNAPLQNAGNRHKQAWQNALDRCRANPGSTFLAEYKKG